MNFKSIIISLLFSIISTTNIIAQETTFAEDSLYLSDEIDEVVITVRKRSTQKLRGVAQNTELISASELKRAACCNLGESFTTNPSVDVSYNDAATGAKQIKLLGLSGTYVQMLTENYPNFRGTAAPYGLGYIPGPWMQSIQVSKGASSVKNGYESISGQINVEMLKPQTDQSVMANMYADHLGKVEVNAAGNIHLTPELSTGLLLHAENAFMSHDSNGDGFMDLPKVRQISGMNRWAWLGEKYVFQAGIKFLDERRESGQDTDHGHVQSSTADDIYRIDIRTQRWEGFTKNAYIFDKENDGNIALILSGSIHDQSAIYGRKLFDVTQKNFYASLMFERKWGDWNALSTGLSFNYDHYDQKYRLTHDPSLPQTNEKDIEGVSGAYAQYTFNYNRRLLIMAGIRYDYSSLYGSMFTPRVHARWNITDQLTIHGSAGRGFRSSHILAENNFLLASSRKIIIDPDLKQENAWNMGGGLSSDIDVFGKTLTISAEYYYTDFRRITVADLDTDAHSVYFRSIANGSYSHTFQAEISYPIIKDLTFSAAYRYTDVKENYGHGFVQKPLTSHSKGLFSINYAPMMGIWQFDITLAINGGGRMPKPYYNTDEQPAWNPTYKPFTQLNAQITRNFRRWAVYIGGENLTGYKQKSPIVDAADPWGENFDATMIYAPIHGAVVYAGFRYTFTKY